LASQYIEEIVAGNLETDAGYPTWIYVVASFTDSEAENITC